MPVKQLDHIQSALRLAAHLQQLQQATAAARDPALQQQLFQQQQALLQHAAASQQQMMAGMLQVSTPQAGSGSRCFLHTHTRNTGQPAPCGQPGSSWRSLSAQQQRGA